MAKFGIALEWGSRGPEFESQHSDHKKALKSYDFKAFLRFGTPNNTELSRYTIYVGNTVNECEEYVWRHIKEFRAAYGDPTAVWHRATGRFLSLEKKMALIHKMMKELDWYQGEN